MPGPRPFLLLAAVLSATLALPGGAIAVNECHNNDPTHHVCVDHTVDLPSQTPQALHAPGGLVEGRYYVYVPIEDCSTSPTSRACTGRAEGPGMTAGALGIVYHETNQYAGLQRHQFGTFQGPYPADTMVLV